MKLTTEKGLEISFVGREKELEDLKRYLAQAKESIGRIIFITGEAGIGKTVLLNEFHGYAESKGVTVLRGKCIHMEIFAPYTPFIEMLKSDRNAAQEGIAGQNTVPSTEGDPLPLSLLPLNLISPMAEKETPPLMDEGGILAQRDRMFDAVSQAIIDKSKEKPLLLLIDDLQWADPASLQLLHYLALRIQSFRILICGAYRIEDIEDVSGKVHPLKNVIHRLSGEKLPVMLRLQGFNREQISSMIHDALGTGIVEDGFINDLHAQSGGNPLFIMEALKSLTLEGLADTDSLSSTTRATLSAIKMPDRIRNIILRRLGNLSVDAKNIIMRCSVIGQDFSYSMLSKVSGVDDDRLLNVLDEMLSTGLIKEDLSSKEETYLFENVHVRSAIYNMLDTLMAETFHRETGNAIEGMKRKSMDEMSYALAYHFTLGKDSAKSFLYSEMAAEQSAKVYAFDDAVKYLKWALEAISMLSDSVETRMKRYRLLERLGDMHQVSNWQSAFEDYKLALDASDGLNDRGITAKAYMNVGMALRMLTRFDDSRTMYYKGLELYESIGDKKGIADVCLGLGITCWRIGQLDEAVSYFNMCIQKAMACGSIHNLGRAFSMVGSILIVKGEFDKASEYLLKGIGELVKVRDYTNIAVSYNNLGDMSLRSGGYDMAIEYFGKCREFAEKVAKKFYVAVACINAGEAYARMGDLKRARVQEDEGLKLIERMGDPIGRMWVYKNYGLIYRLEKKWLEADIAFDTAQKILNGKNLPFEEAELLFERALMLRDKGEKDRAVEHLIMAQKLYSAAGAARNLNDVGKELDSLKGP